MFSSGSAIQAQRALRKIMKKWKHEERRGWGNVALVPHRAIVWARCSPVPRLEELSSHREAKLSEQSYIRNL